MTSYLIDESLGQRVPLILPNEDEEVFIATAPIVKVVPISSRTGEDIPRNLHKYSDSHLFSSNSDLSLEEKTQQHFNTLQQLLTHVPNRVIKLTQNHYANKLPITLSSNHAVFMFIDVSGFTALCEKYCSDITAGKRGIDALTNILNQYLGKLVQHIIESNGDVLKFAGDAVLAMWPCNVSEAYEVLMWVTKTALLLQTKHDNFQADEESILRVKVAISVGEYSTHIFGCNTLLQFAVCGAAVASVNRAQNVATSGSVILSPEAWSICNPADLDYTNVSGGFYHVTAVHLTFDPQWMQNYLQTNSEDPPLMHNIFLSMLKNETDRQSRNQKKNKKIKTDVCNEADAKRGKRMSAVENIKNGFRRLSTFQFRNNNIRVMKDTDLNKATSSFNDSMSQRSAHASSTDTISREISRLSSIGGSISRNSSKSNLKLYRNRKSTVNNILQEQLSISKQLTPNMLDTIKKFLPEAVRSKIESGQSLEWMSELRTISVLFINLDVCIQKLTDEKINLIQEALVYVQEIMNAFDGVVNKIFMFDKGCTILALFGLPHAKHEDDSTRALQASSKIYSHLSLHLKVHTSIGITTGQAFCGVVGHNLRHEYTAISAKVNMAARLMMNFRDKITCDHSTKLRSGVTEANFSEVPAIPLKGIEKPEQIYTFSIRDNSQLEHYAIHCETYNTHDNNGCRELIGREEEMDILLGMLNQITLDENPESHILIITGDTGIGKTLLLKSMKHLARVRSFRVLSCRAGLMEMSSHYHTVRILIERLLQLETCYSLHEREQAILTQFQDACDDDILEYLPLLNDLLMLKYTQTDRVSHLTADQRHTHLHRLLFNIVEQETSNQSCVFVVDDAHYMDNNSWEFLQDLSNHQKVILILAMKELTSSKYQEHLRTIVKCKNARVCYLKGLDHECILELATRLLNVDTLGEDFARFLKERLGTHGNPMWCKEALDTMLNLGLFHIEPVTKQKCSSMEAGSVFSKDFRSDLKATTSYEYRSSTMTARRQSKIQFAAHVNTDAINLPLPESLNDLILARLDKLSASSQLVLKSAAIVGTAFSKSILKRITPNNIKDTTLDQAIEKLIQAGMIECAYASAFLSSTTKNLAKYSQLCSCIQHLAYRDQMQSHSLLNLHTHDHTHDHIYYKCDMLKFTHNYIQEIVYELWTSNQKRLLHETGAKCLESEAHKCSNCGGGAFFNGIHQLETALNELKEEDATNTFDDDFVDNSTIANHRQINKRKRTSSAYMRNGRYGLTLTSNKNSSHNLHSPIQRDSTSTIDLSHCTCSEVLATVYPQLVRHWKAACNYDKIFHYLLEAALASTQVHATLEAQSLLEEAGELIKLGKVKPTLLQQSRFALIKGQSFYNGHHYSEAQLHFLEGLSILNSPLPSSLISFFTSLVKQATPQICSIFNHGYVLQQQQLSQREKHLLNERLAFLSFLINTYYFTNQRYRMLYTTLTMLNQAQSSRINNKALLDSYRMMLKCCELFNFQRGIAHYQSQTALAITLCETSGNDNITELIAYIELISTLVNEQLYSGNLSSAKNYAKRAIRLSHSINALDLLLDILPLWCYIQLHSLELSDVQSTLEELKVCAFDSDDLQQQALYFSYCFDIILETGISEGFIDVLECESYARTCTSHDVFHFNNEERFFLLSCLTLWYARKEIEMDAKIHFAITLKILPNKIESFFAAKGLVRFTECALILWARDRCYERRKLALNALDQLTQACHTFTVLKPRMLLLKSYFNVIKRGSRSKSQKLMSEAKREANNLNSDLEILWIQHQIDFWSKSYGGNVIEVFSDTKLWQESRYDRMRLEIYSLQRERKNLTLCLQPTNCEFSQDPNLTPPLPESELLDETLQNRPLTPDLPPPPSLILAGNITQGQMEHTQSNPQKLYPELDTLSPPPPLWDQKETLSQLPQFPLTPPSPPPAEYFLTPSDRQPVPIPEMEHNPLFVPDPTPSPLKTELLMLGSIPPAAASLVMNPLNQIILAQQQALSQHFSANIPHIPLTQQIHPNYLTAFQNYSSQNHYNLSPGAFGNISEVQSNLNGNDDDCIAEWKRDLILKEKRILKDKFGDNYVNIVTESYPIIQPPQFQCDPEEIENMFPAPPYPQSPSEFHSIQTNGDSTEDISTVQRCEEDQTPLPDRISYPSLNSSDEDSVPININQQIKNEHILPGFISRMKDRNSPQMISQDWVIPPSEAGYISPIPIPMTYYDIQAQTSTLFQEDIPSLQQQTIRYDNTQFVVKDKPIHRTQTELVPRSDRAILYPPVEHPPTHQLPTGPMIKPPSYDTTPPREIKRPPGDTSGLNSTPSPYKPANREISYPPGLESSVSPKKQVIYPPSSTKKICYPPSKEILRPPVSLNKTCVSNSNNDISYSAEREILYPHSWTEAPPSSPSSSPFWEIHYPPKSAVPQPDENKIEDIPEIPREISTIDGDITPPIVDSSGEEDNSQVAAIPRESTPKKQPLPSQKDDKIDSETENCGFETPTEVD
ncbi:Adenylate cyclase type 10 [Oopsacas minuta]|uniref:Adenylate cyclase type 10 n=1 Tax=Oopsacas minuta TaxID=111878 RepID=A0AAV7K581_9METZ|nr:Adenylate cyclase type 10 [Oopsacas minuta]